MINAKDIHKTYLYTKTVPKGKRKQIVTPEYLADVTWGGGGEGFNPLNFLQT